MILELKEMLKTITQFDDVSLQPNSGANVLLFKFKFRENMLDY